MPPQCECPPVNEHAVAYPQSVQQPAAAAAKKQWYSYDESDKETVYGFQRKKRFGVKNDSEAVKYCLMWRMPKTERNGLANSDDTDEEEEPRIQQRQGRKQPQQLTAKIGSDDDDEWPREDRVRPVSASTLAKQRKVTPKVGSDDEDEDQLEGRVRIQRSVADPTPKVGQAGPHAAYAADAYEVEQIKQALRRNQESTQRLLSSLAKKGHTCGGQVGARPAWEQIPLSQVLDGETGVARDLRSASPPPLPGRQNEAVQTNSARFSPDTAEPSTRSPTGFALPLAELAAREQATATAKQPVVLSARLSARVSARKDRAAQEKHDVSRKMYSSQLLAQSGGEGKTHPPKASNKGLGNTLLGSPHDPRELHDPESIDPVWRRRQEEKERARRLNSLLGKSAADKPIVDEKQYEASILKQHARRLKIRNFELRHQERRLKNPPVGSTTRDFSETWMSVVSGKPPFCSYGNGNTAPATGGVVYGNYMLSHSCSPERRPNRPSQKQTTNEARRVKQVKQRENAKTLRRLFAAGEVVPDASHALPRPHNTAQKLQGEYDERGRLIVEVPDVPRHAAGAPVQAVGVPSAPQPQVVLQASARNVSAHFGALSPAGGSSSVADLRLPLERALAWNTANHTADARRSGRKQGFAEQDIIGGRNTLAETSARTMSALPQPEAHPKQAW